jgi:hypothetical protein
MQKKNTTIYNYIAHEPEDIERQEAPYFDGVLVYDGICGIGNMLN